MMKKKWLLVSFNKKFFLKVGNRVFRCQIGEKGLNNGAKKVEGDKTTPTGKWDLKSLYFRYDRVLIPKLKKKNILKINRITEHCGWCNDVNNKFYNKYINIKHSSFNEVSYERLWRKDNVYDLIIEMSYNSKPIIKNKGSAIFIHCSFKDFRATAGCVALKKTDLMFLIKNINSKVYIQIKK